MTDGAVRGREAGLVARSTWTGCRCAGCRCSCRSRRPSPSARPARSRPRGSACPRARRCRCRRACGPGRASPNDAGDRAADRPDQLTRALLDRAGRGRALERRRRRAPARPRAMRGRSSSTPRCSRTLRQRAALVRARRRELVARRDAAGSGREAIWSRSRRMRSAASCSRCSSFGELDGLVLGLVAQAAHAVGDLAVLVGDALEELGALEQVARSRRPRAPRSARRACRTCRSRPAASASSRRAVASSLRRRASRSRATSSRSRTSSSSSFWRSRLDCARSRRCWVASISPWRPSMRVLKLWIVVREHALLLLGLVDLVALLVDAIGQGRRQPRQREHEIGGQAQGDWEPEALLHGRRVPLVRFRG